MRILSSLFIGLVASCSLLSHAAQWQLQDESSQLNFISTKNTSIAEVHSFTSLSGSIDNNGKAILTINLPSVETNIGIRNERMNKHVFETSTYPVANFSTQIDNARLAKLSVGESTVVTLTGTLDLHGVQQPINTDVTVVKLTNNQITVATLKPIIVSAAAFNLDEGVATLQSIAKLAHISLAVPVTFNLTFSH